MLLYWSITFIISVAAIIDWKRTVLAWLPISMLFNPCVCLRYESPALSLVLAVNFVLVAIYIIKRKVHSTYPFMFKNSCVAYLISYLFSLIFSIAPFTIALTETIRFFVNSFVVVFLFHKALNDYRDISFFVKSALIVFVPIIMLGIFEGVFHDNPWLDFVYLTVPNAELIGTKMYYLPPFLTPSGDLSTRFGLVRCYSFFKIHIEFGCACLFYLFTFLYYTSNNGAINLRIKNRYFMIVSLLCLIGVFLCNSKTPFVGLFFFVLSVYPLRKLLSVKAAFLFASFICLGLIVLSSYEGLFDTFFSLFDADKMEEGGGSSAEMRKTQFAVAFDFFMNNPLFGNGLRSLPILHKKNPDIWGAESSWMIIPIQQGIVGLIAYLILYGEIYEHLSRSVGKRTSVLFLIGLMALETVTGPMSFYIFAPSLVAIERYNQLKRFTPKKSILFFLTYLKNA